MAKSLIAVRGSHPRAVHGETLWISTFPRRAGKPSVVDVAQSQVRNRTRYLVELATPDGTWRDVDRLIQRARDIANRSKDVRFVRAIFVPEDSTCFLLYEADSARAVRAAAARAELDVTRVSEVVPTEQDEGTEVEQG